MAKKIKTEIKSIGKRLKKEDYMEALEVIYKNIEEVRKGGNKSITFKLKFPLAIKKELKDKGYTVEEREVKLPSNENDTEIESIWFTIISWEN